MPKRLTKEDTTATDTYAKFIAEPFETGYGHTVGNSLRRVLLSSLEGAAISSTTPSMVANSCIAPSTLREEMAAPSREERSTRRRELPTVWP